MIFALKTDRKNTLKEPEVKRSETSGFRCHSLVASQDQTVISC